MSHCPILEPIRIYVQWIILIAKFNISNGFRQIVIPLLVVKSITVRWGVSVAFIRSHLNSAFNRQSMYITPCEYRWPSPFRLILQSSSSSEQVRWVKSIVSTVSWLLVYHSIKLSSAIMKRNVETHTLCEMISQLRLLTGGNAAAIGSTAFSCPIFYAGF